MAAARLINIHSIARQWRWCQYHSLDALVWKPVELLLNLPSIRVAVSIPNESHTIKGFFQLEFRNLKIPATKCAACTFIASVVLHSRKCKLVINRLCIIHDGTCYANKMLHIVLAMRTTNIYLHWNVSGGFELLCAFANAHARSATAWPKTVCKCTLGFLIFAYVCHGIRWMNWCYYIPFEAILRFTRIPNFDLCSVQCRGQVEQRFAVPFINRQRQ